MEDLWREGETLRERIEVLEARLVAALSGLVSEGAVDQAAHAARTAQKLLAASDL